MFVMLERIYVNYLQAKDLWASRLFLKIISNLLLSFLDIYKFVIIFVV